MKLFSNTCVYFGENVWEMATLFDWEVCFLLLRITVLDIRQLNSRVNCALTDSADIAFRRLIRRNRISSSSPSVFVSFFFVRLSYLALHFSANRKPRSLCSPRSLPSTRAKQTPLFNWYFVSDTNPSNFSPRLGKPRMQKLTSFSPPLWETLTIKGYINKTD